MNKHFYTVAFTISFVAGVLAIGWVGAGFINASFLALLMTAVIGAVYVSGAIELQQFRKATFSLTRALAAIPEDLAEFGDWLGNVHVSLQNSVRLRVEGDRVGLPGPALTPYLVGLLVMLGMLGTFLGMVVTLKGAVFALEGTTDLQAIRSALAVPVMGLGIAFGTSVAGIAASAMLGLMSALSRRERMLAAQLLDTKIATVLRRFSLAHQRQETFRVLQSQSRSLPEVADKLQAMMVQMETMNRQLGQQLSERLLGNQEDFHSSIKNVYSDLAGAVDRSLRESLCQSAHAAGESIKPVVEAAMDGIALEGKRMHERMVETVQQQLDGVSSRFGETAATVSSTWTAALSSHERASARIVAEVGRSLDEFSETFQHRSAALVAAVGDGYANLQSDQAERDRQQHRAWTQSLEALASALTHELQQTGAQTLRQQQEICSTLTRTAQEITEIAQSSARATLVETARLITGAEELMRSRIASESQWINQHRDRMDQLADLLRTELGALKDEEAARGNAAADRLAQLHNALQTALTGHLTTLGTALEEPITRLIETASEAPRAAAEVIGQLRREISVSVARDNALLEERSRIMETLNALLNAINHASVEQRAVIDSLVASSSAALSASANAFSENVAVEASKLADISAHVTSSAVDVSSLSEAFGFAVQAFGEASEKLIENLQRIEGTMDKSMARSDEQLAYYVAQAREIIDLSMSSQKEIFEELRQFPAKQALFAEEAR